MRRNASQTRRLTLNHGLTHVAKCLRRNELEVACESVSLIPHPKRIGRNDIGCVCECVSACPRTYAHTRACARVCVRGLKQTHVSHRLTNCSPIQLGLNPLKAGLESAESVFDGLDSWQDHIPEVSSCVQVIGQEIKDPKPSLVSAFVLAPAGAPKFNNVVLVDGLLISIHQPFGPLAYWNGGDDRSIPQTDCLVICRSLFGLCHRWIFRWDLAASIARHDSQDRPRPGPRSVQRRTSDRVPTLRQRSPRFDWYVCQSGISKAEHPLPPIGTSRRFPAGDGRGNGDKFRQTFFREKGTTLWSRI